MRLAASPLPRLDGLRLLASRVAACAYVPYSREPVGGVALLRDGRWVPGVRVENASYPLTIPAVQATIGAVVASGLPEVVAFALSRPLTPDEALFVQEALGGAVDRIAPDVLVRAGIPLPAPDEALPLALMAPVPTSASEGLHLARQIAQRARVPNSHFPVGCVLETTAGLLLPGCNMEFTDWTRGLCAERVAFATACALGLRSFRRLYLSCPKAPGASPCGACRQVLHELAPGLDIVIDHGDAPAVHTTPDQLLPHAFRPSALPR